MMPSANIEEARDHVFRKIGRNLSNFQIIESMLKFVLTNSRFSSIASKAEENFTRHASIVRLMTFGELVERLPSALSGQTDEPSDSTQDPWISIAVGSSALPPESLRGFRREMRLIVRDRNQLVHHMLADIDQSSLEAWKALDVELDAQRERTIQVFERVRLLATTVLEVRQALAKNTNVVVEALVSDVPSNDA